MSEDFIVIDGSDLTCVKEYYCYLFISCCQRFLSGKNWNWCNKE